MGAGAPEHRLWHPVAASADVTGDQPVPVRLLGVDLALWRDTTGAPQVLFDRCPHRGARLSLGRVQGSHLRCPYHGWRFDGSGTCLEIPALQGFTPNQAHRAQPHAAVDAHGLTWVRLAGADDIGGLDVGPASDPSGPVALEAAPPAWDAERAPELRKLLCGPYDVATSAPRVIENFLDLSHFGFVHQGWLGDPSQAAVPDYTVDTDASGGVRLSGCRAWQPKSHRLADGGSEVDYGYVVPSPYVAMLDKRAVAEAGHRDAIALFACPMEPESTRVWFRLAVTDHASTDEQLRAFQHEIFMQDRPVLESQRPRRLPLAPGAEAHSAADRGSAAYRRWLRLRGTTFGTC